VKKKISFAGAQGILSDSSRQVSNEQLDSINLLISNPGTEKKETPVMQPGMAKIDAPEMSARKMPENTVAVSNLSLTKAKLDENIEHLNKANEEENLLMHEITKRQQKITLMLSRMVNQVVESQDTIIQHLK
jgi:hypothetical protein